MWDGLSVRITQWSQATPVLCGGRRSAETGSQLSGFLYVLPTVELFPSRPSPTSLIVVSAHQWGFILGQTLFKLPVVSLGALWLFLCMYTYDKV